MARQHTVAREGRPRRRAVLVLFLIGVSTALAGCGSPPRLAHLHASDEALAEAVLDAVYRHDTEALTRLSVSREEFDRVVWPMLPASRPEVGMSSGYVWRDSSLKSRAGLAEALREWGGRRLRLVRVEFLGKTTDHGAYSISRKTQLVVRDTSGAEHRVRLFGSIIRQDGGSKVYSYIVD